MNYCVLKNPAFLFTIYAIWMVFTTLPSFIICLCFFNNSCSDSFSSGSCFELSFGHVCSKHVCSLTIIPWTPSFISYFTELLHTTFVHTLIFPELFKSLLYLCRADEFWCGQELKAKTTTLDKELPGCLSIHICACEVTTHGSKKKDVEKGFHMVIKRKKRPFFFGCSSLTISRSE